MFGIFKFHAEREIHLESLYSSLMTIASMFGASVFISHSHGAFNLSGSLSHAMKILSTILLLGFLAVEGIWSRFSRRDAYLLSCYVIPGSVILSNVLSPQYFIWAFPLLLLLAVEIFPARHASPWILGALSIAVGAMTIWIFPYNFVSTELNPHALVPMIQNESSPPASIPALILGLRNFAYLGVVIWLGVMLYKRIDQVNASSGD